MPKKQNDKTYPGMYDKNQVSVNKPNLKANNVFN